MDRIKVAVIGTGFFSQYHYDAWRRLPGVSLVALTYGSNRARADEIAAKFGVPAIFDNAEAMMDATRPDVVDIVSPPDTHLALVQEAAKRGLFAITQKPLAPSFADAQRVVATARSSTAPVVVHENWRFKPWFREARNLIREGAIGDLYSVTFRMRPGDGQGPSAYLDRQPYFQKMPRFLIHETGVHMIDVFRFLCGEVTAVSARLRRINPVIAGEDAGYVIFDFRSGATGMLDGNRLSDFPADNPRLTMGALLMEGSKGQLWLEGDGRIFLRTFQGAATEHIYSWQNRAYGGDAVYLLQRHVVDHLRNGSPLENTAEAYLPNAALEDAIYRSHNERRVVDIPALEQCVA